MPWLRGSSEWLRGVRGEIWVKPTDILRGFARYAGAAELADPVRAGSRSRCLPSSRGWASGRAPKRSGGFSSGERKDTQTPTQPAPPTRLAPSAVLPRGKGDPSRASAASLSAYLAPLGCRDASPTPSAVAVRGASAWSAARPVAAGPGGRGRGRGQGTSFAWHSLARDPLAAI